jgi:hypothetical protein
LDVERKKREIPKHMWDVEYELGEPSIEGRVLELADVDFMFDPDEGRKAGGANDHISIELPVPEGRYVTGIDWAKSTDWTIISTWRTDCSPWRRVAWSPVRAHVVAGDHQLRQPQTRSIRRRPRP